MASYSASVCPPGTPNTCRTPCSASRPASSAPPWAASAIGDPEQAGGVASEHELLGGAEAERADLADGVVGAHVERAVRPEQELLSPRVAGQVREQVLVVGDGVVVEAPQRDVRLRGDAGAGLGADGEGPPQPAADHRQRAPAVGEQHAQPRMPVQHPGHGHVRGRYSRLHRVAHRVPQVVAVQGGHAEAAGGGVDEHESPGVLGGRPERQEEIVAEIPSGHAGRDLHPCQAAGHQAGHLPGGERGVLQHHGADRAHPPRVCGGDRGECRVVHLADHSRLGGLSFRRYQRDPRRQQQVINAGGRGRAEHGADLGELAHDGADVAAAERQPVPSVLPPDRRAPVFRHRPRGHLLNDDVTVNVNDQGAGTFAGPAPAPFDASPADTAPPRYRAPISGCSSTSLPVPARRTWPFSSTTPWVDNRSPARAFCSTSRIVLPWACIIRTASKTDLSTFGARPMDGSSSTTTDGSSISERANCTSRCWPPDRLPAFCPSQPVTWGNISSTASSLRSASRRSDRMYPPSQMFSRTVISRNRLWFCGTCTTPILRICRGLRPTMGSPCRVIWPCLGRSSPLIARSRVDFPAPFGPTTQVIPPCTTSRLTPRSTSPPP